MSERKLAEKYGTSKSQIHLILEKKEIVLSHPESMNKRQRINRKMSSNRIGFVGIPSVFEFNFVVFLFFYLIFLISKAYSIQIGSKNTFHDSSVASVEKGIV